MKLLREGNPLIGAAVRAGMSEPTARKYARLGLMPSAVKPPRTWRTRPDPYAAVWPEIESWLKLDAGLEAKTIWMALNERHGGRFSAGQLRTLQRRVHAWRAQSGPPREVFFPQVHRPADQGQSDFTDMRELAVTIAGEAFAHLLYHFVLTYSNWEWAMICPSESFESLSAGLQGALWTLGGTPGEHRTDNLSAATHELAESRGRDFTVRYQGLLDHYRLRGSRNFPGNAHENGDVESANGHLKNAIDRRLQTRFGSAYTAVRMLADVGLHAHGYRTLTSKPGRLFLREWFGGKIRLEPLPDGGAHGPLESERWRALQGPRVMW
jgi:transposase